VIYSHLGEHQAQESGVIDTREAAFSYFTRAAALAAGSVPKQRTRVLLRADFSRIPGMETPEGFLRTIQECERAVLVITPQRVNPPTGQMEMRVWKLLKPWGQVEPEKCPLDLAMVCDELLKLKLATDQPKNIRLIDLSPALRTAYQDKTEEIDAFFTKRLQETNWFWASRSLNEKWEEPGATGVKDRAQGGLRMLDGAAARRMSPQELVGMPIQLDILPDLLDHAKAMSKEGRFLQHHGWMIMPTHDSNGVVMLGPASYSTGPHVIMKKRNVAPPS